jgi:hypothetical protein
MLLGRIGLPGLNIDLQVVAVLPLEHGVGGKWKDSGRVGPEATLNEFSVEPINASGVSTHEFVDLLLVEQ